MNSLDWRWRATKKGSACEAGAPICTSTMAAAAAAAGKAECITMHNWQ
jgi:hypothetical protein